MVWYFQNLPSVNVGSASAVNVGVSYLFAIISERWWFLVSEQRWYDIFKIYLQWTLVVHRQWTLVFLIFFLVSERRWHNIFSLLPSTIELVVYCHLWVGISFSIYLHWTSVDIGSECRCLLSSSLIQFFWFTSDLFSWWGLLLCFFVFCGIPSDTLRLFCSVHMHS